MFLEKKYLFFIFYTFTIYHYTRFIYPFLFLSFFFCNFFSLHLLKKKTIIQILRKKCFIEAIAILFYSFASLRIGLIFYMFLLTHNIYYNLLYTSIDFLIHGYIFYSMSKKHVNNTYILILLYLK